MRRALTKTLRDALDIYHKVVFDTYVIVKRLEDFGLSIQETILALFLISFGIMVYYVVPYAFLFRMLNIFFRVLTLILLGNLK